MIKAPGPFREGMKHGRAKPRKIATFTPPNLLKFAVLWVYRYAVKLLKFKRRIEK